MKKANTLLFLFLVGIMVVFAQDNDKTKQILNNAPFIFKGTVKSYKAFRKENDKKLYASYLINIETIYKGTNKLKLGTVELIYDAPDTWELSDEWGLIKDKVFSDYYNGDDSKQKYPFELNHGVAGIFVCNRNTDKGLSASDIKTTNNIILTPICGTSDCFFVYGSSAIHKNHEFFPRKIIKGFGKYFEQTGKIDKKTGVTIWDEETTVWEKLNNYLKKIGITPQKKNVKKKDVTFLERKKQNETTYRQRVKKYQAILN